MKLNKNELNGKWFKADKETFDALVKAGCEPLGKLSLENGIKYGYFRIGGSSIGSLMYTEIGNHIEQAFHHQGEFYTIDGEWLVDEDGFTEVARIPITEEEEKAILNNADKWQAISNYIDSRPAEQKEGARLKFERLKPEMKRLQARQDELKEVIADLIHPIKPKQYQIGIDTFERMRANATFEEAMGFIRWNIDRYNTRKKGQDLSDYHKMKDYCDEAIWWIENRGNKDA